ncbi:hypothetical protein L7F22_055589 [Adiantum nelumboides]|nr:hypothetical protein [Adiantum nelumboides]
MFKLTKQHKHTVPDLSLTFAMDEVRLDRSNACKNWCQYFHQEILEAAKSKGHQRYVACGEYLTHIAYYLIGAIDDLPPPLRPNVAAPSPAKRKRARADKKTKEQVEEEASSEIPSEFMPDTEEEVTTSVAAKLHQQYKEATAVEEAPVSYKRKHVMTGEESESEIEKLRKRERRTKRRQDT